METVKVTISDKLYIPIEAFRSLPSSIQKGIIGKFQKVIYDPHLCEVYQTGRKCNTITSFLKDNPNASPLTVCRKCPNAHQHILCYRINKKFISFYRGDIQSINNVLENLKDYYKVTVEDKRSVVPLPEQLQFKVQWDKLNEKKVEQERIANLWLEEKYGVAIAPPRFGKSILGAIIASNLGQRTAVFAHQVELLEQFHKDWLFATTLKPYQIKINPSIEEVDELAVCLFTYQQFISTYGVQRIKSLRRKFGFILVDEVHKSASDRYTRVLNCFSAKYRCGLTATYNRRDQKEFRVHHTFGPPIVKGGSEQLSCNFRKCHTGWIIPNYKSMNNRTWSYLWASLASNKDRNMYIVRQVLKDLDKDHKIIIPVRYVRHVQELATLIRKYTKKEGFRNLRVLEYSNQLIKGKKNREVISQQIRDGYWDVVVAVSSMIELGFNCPKFSCIYLNTSGYEFDLNKLYQKYSRVRTPSEGKQTPLIRLFVDNGNLSYRSTEVISKHLSEMGFNELKPVGLKQKIRI